MKQFTILFFFLLVLAFSGCEKCKECTVEKRMTLTREYNFPVEQFPDTTFDSVTLCEEELDELSGKSVMSDSVAQGLEVTVETIYTCK